MDDNEWVARRHARLAAQVLIGVLLAVVLVRLMPTVLGDAHGTVAGGDPDGGIVRLLDRLPEVSYALLAYAGGCFFWNLWATARRDHGVARRGDDGTG